MIRTKALPYILWLLASLLLAGCGPDAASETPKPENLLSPEEMVTILTEVHIAESRVNKLGLTSSDSSAIVYKRLKQQIYKKLKVDTAAYNSSYTYYAANPTKLEAIYKEVVKKLEAKITPPKTKNHL